MDVSLDDFTELLKADFAENKWDPDVQDHVFE
jgi:hypothetical protein